MADITSIEKIQLVEKVYELLGLDFTEVTLEEAFTKFHMIQELMSKKEFIL